MGTSEFIKQLKGDKKKLAAVMVLGISGLVMIMLSSFFPDKETKKEKVTETQSPAVTSMEYCKETEKKLTEFLGKIEGVGEVQVYLTVSGDETYVYATEGKTSVSENKTEEEYKYVMIGGSGDKTALIETVQSPEICGAVIACSGCDSPAVQEKVYRAVSAALDIPTARIYVTKLK